MVHEANTKQANAEKQLKEALGKVMILVRRDKSSGLRSDYRLIRSSNPPQTLYLCRSVTERSHIW